MKRTYHCLACQAVLNPNIKIVLVVQCTDRKGLVLLSPQPGNYSTIFADHLGLEKGEMVRFLCPVCGVDLTSKASPRLARLGVELGDGNRGWVDFSRIFGEQATFVVVGDQVQPFGEDHELYQELNFFGEGFKG
jgi:hypothetical protein